MVIAKNQSSILVKIKIVIGKFKDEAAGHPITEFVGLKSQMYYTTEIKTDSDSESDSDTESSAQATGSEIKTEIENHKTAKGIKKNVIERDLQHSDYLSCLQKNNMIRHKMKGIRSEYHQVSSYQFIKISLSCYDDKRYIHNDGITSYAYGHYKINQFFITKKKIDKHYIL